MMWENKQQTTHHDTRSQCDYRGIPVLGPRSSMEMRVVRQGTIPLMMECFSSFISLNWPVSGRHPDVQAEGLVWRCLIHVSQLGFEIPAATKATANNSSILLHRETPSAPALWLCFASNFTMERVESWAWEFWIYQVAWKWMEMSQNWIPGVPGKLTQRKVSVNNFERSLQVHRHKLQDFKRRPFTIIHCQRVLFWFLWCVWNQSSPRLLKMKNDRIEGNLHLSGLAKYLELRSRVQGNGPRALEVQKLRKACEKRVERCWKNQTEWF